MMTHEHDLNALDARIAQLGARAEELERQIARQGRDIALFDRQVKLLLHREGEKAPASGPASAPASGPASAPAPSPPRRPAPR